MSNIIRLGASGDEWARQRGRCEPELSENDGMGAHIGRGRQAGDFCEMRRRGVSGWVFVSISASVRCDGKKERGARSKRTSAKSHHHLSHVAGIEAEAVQ